MSNRTVTVDGVALRVVDRGDGPPFVLQHGLCGSAQSVVAELAPSGHRVVSLDFRGHGGSEIGPADGFTYRRFAADLSAVLDELEIERAVIGGVSMGAGVATRFAMAHPDRTLGLVLIRPVWSGDDDAHLDLLGDVARVLRMHGPVAGTEVFRRSAAYSRLRAVSEGNAAAAIALFAEPRALEAVVRLERMSADRPWDDPGDLGDVTAPALVIGTPDDVVHPLRCARWLTGRLPCATLRVVPAKYTDRPAHLDEVRTAVDGFLRSLERVPC